MADGDYALTRRDVAAKLGRSISTVRRMEFDVLHPVYDEYGVWRFDTSEVERVSNALRQARPRRKKRRRSAADREGQQAARVLDLFERGATLADIVRRMRIAPRRVRRLYSDWKT